MINSTNGFKMKRIRRCEIVIDNKRLVFFVNDTILVVYRIKIMSV